jgi:hypothetical protein
MFRTYFGIVIIPVFILALALIIGLKKGEKK